MVCFKMQLVELVEEDVFVCVASSLLAFRWPFCKSHCIRCMNNIIGHASVTEYIYSYRTTEHKMRHCAEQLAVPLTPQ